MDVKGTRGVLRLFGYLYSILWAEQVLWRRDILAMSIYSPTVSGTFHDQHHFSSVQSLSCVRLFATLWTAACQAFHPSPTPGACSNSCPSSRWCHPTISSFVIPFSSCLHSFPASESFPISQLFPSGGQSGASLFSISPSNEYLGLISLRVDWLIWSPCNPRDSQESSPTPQLESINF